MDKIIASVPIDKTAALVTGKGYQYTPDKKVLTADQSFPIPTRSVAKNMPDLTGLRCGRLVVIGLARDTAKRWVVRCDCSTFTLRTAKAIRNPANGGDKCEHCRHLDHLKERAEFLASPAGKASRRQMKPAV